MKLAIMQPYFLPYIGYFQLMHAVDYFVVYDDAQYTKKGWINRNRFLMNGKDQLFTLPLKKASDYLNVVDRHLADDYLQQERKILNQIKNAYNKAPQFSQIYPIIEGCFLYKTNSLFEWQVPRIFNSAFSLFSLLI